MKPNDRVRVWMSGGGSYRGRIVQVQSVDTPSAIYFVTFGDNVGGWFSREELTPDTEPTPAMRSHVDLLRGAMGGARAMARRLEREWGTLSASRIEGALFVAHGGEALDRRATVRR